MDNTTLALMDYQKHSLQNCETVTAVEPNGDVRVISPEWEGERHMTTDGTLMVCSSGGGVADTQIVTLIRKYRRSSVRSVSVNGTALGDVENLGRRHGWTVYPRDTCLDGVRRPFFSTRKDAVLWLCQSMGYTVSERFNHLDTRRPS